MEFFSDAIFALLLGLLFMQFSVASKIVSSYYPRREVSASRDDRGIQALGLGASRFWPAAPLPLRWCLVESDLPFQSG